jgi:glycosyltransferase involved in cell wall biosynthesis
MILYPFPPSGEVGCYRGVRFIKNMVEFGWHPIVLAPSNAVYSIYDYNIINEIVSKCVIYRAPLLFPKISLGKSNTAILNLTQSYLFKILDRIMLPDAKVLWIPFALFKAIRLIRRQQIQLVYATGSPFSCFILALLVKLVTKKKLILDYRDPWSINQLRRKNRVIRMVESFLDKSAVTNADGILFSSRRTCDTYQKRYAAQSNALFKAIENSYDHTLNLGRHKKIEEEHDGICRIIYAGSFYGDRNPINFFKAIKLSFERNQELRQRIQFHYFGINHLSPYNRLLRDLEIQDVVFPHDPVPLSDLYTYYSNSDILLLINHCSKGHELYIPQKFFEYLMMEKPILCLTKEGSLRDIVTETNAGLIADPEDTKDISDKIEESYIRFYLNKEKCTIRNKIKYSSYEKTKQLCEVMNEIL